MALTNYEKETVILFNEAEDTAIVNTANSALTRRLAALAESRPGEVVHKKSNPPFVEYVVPKKWIKIVPPRVLSEKQRESNIRKAALMREKRLAPKSL